jgi:branched-chain amino acid transport system ATP-binding protein
MTVAPSGPSRDGGNPLAALGAADRVYVMDRGLIVHEGAAQALREDAALRGRLLGL